MTVSVRASRKVVGSVGRLRFVLGVGPMFSKMGRFRIVLRRLVNFAIFGGFVEGLVGGGC